MGRFGLPVAVCLMTSSITHVNRLEPIKKWFDSDRNPTRWFVVGNTSEGGCRWFGLNKVLEWFQRNCKPAWRRDPCYHANEMQIRQALTRACQLLEGRGVDKDRAWRRAVESVAAVAAASLCKLPPSEWKEKHSHFTASRAALSHLMSLS